MDGNKSDGAKRFRHRYLGNPSPSLVECDTFQSVSSMDNEDRLLSKCLKAEDIHAIRTRQTMQRTFSSIISPTKRLSRQSSLTWGHKPSIIVGASCFLFLLPIPLLVQSCCHVSAVLMAGVTVSSFLSDHCYTGLESVYHTIDRALAPIAFAVNLHSVYTNFGLGWASASILAVICHIFAHSYSRKGMYSRFVIWHSLWHAVGAGLIVLCYALNESVGTCSDGREKNLNAL